MRNIQDILNNVLDIIDYKEDKKKFIDEFTKIVVQTAFLETLAKIPENSKEALQKISIDTVTEEERFKILEREMDKTLYKKQERRVTNRLFVRYIRKIAPILPDEKQMELQKYLESQVTT